MNTIFYRIRLFFLASLIILLTGGCKGQGINLVTNGISYYRIRIPVTPDAATMKAATVLQQYIFAVSGAKLDIVNIIDDMPTIISLGCADCKDEAKTGKLRGNDYLVSVVDETIFISGAPNGKGTLYGVYYFIEKYLGCKKVSNIPAYIPQQKNIKIPEAQLEVHRATFEYCEVYNPQCHDAEFRDWMGLDQLDETWGLWGHTFNKLVPAKTYFKDHPEYYSLVNGKRQATQLCLSNDKVFKIVVEDLKTRMAQSPKARYWSISPNDDNGYCTCEKCKAVDDAEGGPQGSLIKFVNKVAAEFPDKKFATLAYGYSHRPTKKLKPNDNVYIFLSDIDAYRDKPLSEEGSAATFRNDLSGWRNMTANIFIWDYITEFTNYLAPFPDMMNFKENIKLFKSYGVKGVFMQGSGDTYSALSALKTYLSAKLFWDDNADVAALTTEFLNQYYGKGAPYIQQYLDMLTIQMIESHRKLDIYGNPVNEWNRYLTPELIENYNSFFDQADDAIVRNVDFRDRIIADRLQLDYTVLQQARMYGIELHGIFIKDDADKWVVPTKFKEKITRFVANCKKAGVTELSEGGKTPDQYQEEWNSIFKTGVTPTIAIGAQVTLKYPFVEDYPAKGNRTLVDGNTGYDDFSYNWLCFYGTPMEATIDLGKIQTINNVRADFLDDPRHWIFAPSGIKIELSEDGKKYSTLSEKKAPSPEEHYNISIIKHSADNSNHKKARYIRVTANNLNTLPEWRSRENKKPMIACDEIYVQ